MSFDQVARYRNSPPPACLYTCQNCTTSHLPFGPVSFLPLYPPLQVAGSPHTRSSSNLHHAATKAYMWCELKQTSSIVSTFQPPSTGGTKSQNSPPVSFPTRDRGVRPVVSLSSSSQTATPRSELSRERCKPWRISMYNCVATCRSIRGAYPLKDCDCVDESQIFAVHGDGDWAHQKLPTAGEIGFSLNIFSNERRP